MVLTQVFVKQSVACFQWKYSTELHLAFLSSVPQRWAWRTTHVVSSFTTGFPSTSAEAVLSQYSGIQYTVPTADTVGKKSRHFDVHCAGSGVFSQSTSHTTKGCDDAICFSTRSLTNPVSIIVHLLYLSFIASRASPFHSSGSFRLWPSKCTHTACINVHTILSTVVCRFWLLSSGCFW